MNGDNSIKPLQPLLMEAGKDTPFVSFDNSSGKCEITGRSFPLNAKGFYIPVLDWLDRYSRNSAPETTFVFKLEYFNTPSSKCITDILKILKLMRDTGKKVTVYWYYEEDDVDILDLGHVFSRTIDIPFEFREYN
jgi:hypothetical protein